MRPILDCKKWPKILWFGPKKGCFRPKIALAAENNTFGRNFSYGRIFGWGRISDFSKPFLAVTVFRQKFSFGHTLNLVHRELRNATFEGKKIATSIKRLNSDNNALESLSSLWFWWFSGSDRPSTDDWAFFLPLRHFLDLLCFSDAVHSQYHEEARGTLWGVC